VQQGVCHARIQQMQVIGQQMRVHQTLAGNGIALAGVRAAGAQPQRWQLGAGATVAQDNANALGVSVYKNFWHGGLNKWLWMACSLLDVRQNFKR
jgi:hypothetical protein